MTGAAALAAGGHINAVSLTVFLVLFAAVTVIGFFAARWRRPADALHLDEWGLGGRGFGTIVSWFLLGGDLYTAYTFIAVPALIYGVGAAGFYAVPYTIIAWPLVFLFLPRLWSVARSRGYVTLADFARDATARARSRWRWRSPGSSPPCPTSRCNWWASRRCWTPCTSAAAAAWPRTCRC